MKRILSCYCACKLLYMRHKLQTCASRYLYTIVAFLLISNAVYSQTFDNLKIEEDKYAYGDISRFYFRNIFGTFNKTILLVAGKYSWVPSNVPRKIGKYYVLDANSNKINEIFLQDTNYVPLAFLNNDTIVLRDKKENDWLFFSESQNKYIKDIPKSLKALLEKIPLGIDKDEYICKFTETQDAMILCVNGGSESLYFTIYSYNYNKDSVEKQDHDISRFCEQFDVIVNVYWVDSNNLLFILFNPVKGDTYCLYNIKSKKNTKIKLPEKYAGLDDYYNGYFLMQVVSKPYQAAIYDFDIKTLQFTLKYKIYAEKGQYNYLYRLGFVSPTKIARMVGSAADFTSFSPIYNQIFNLFEIKFEKVDN